MEGRDQLRGSLLAAGALLMGAGCQGWHVQRDAILPTQLALLVEDRGGHPLSIVMDLRRNTRDQLDVRVSEGERLFDGRHLWDIVVHKDDAGYRARLSDMIANESRELPLLSSTPPELVAFDRMDVWLRTSGGLVHCALTREMCEASTEAGRGALDHMGPGRGFKLTLQPDGDMRLTLPLDPTDEGQIILQNVERVIGAHWVHEGFLQRDPTLDRVFRGRASLGAVLREVRVDGALNEWLTAQPLVVESPWQIESGADDWDGPRDASFSVTAAYSSGQVCFAGRIRDDHVGPGDEMALQVGAARLIVPLDGRPISSGTGAVEGDWYGRRFEACLPISLPLSGTLPFFAAFTDADGSGSQTVLASAPEGEPDVFGTIRASP